MTYDYDKLNLDPTIDFFIYYVPFIFEYCVVCRVLVSRGTNKYSKVLLCYCNTVSEYCTE